MKHIEWIAGFNFKRHCPKISIYAEKLVKTLALPVGVDVCWS